MKNIVLIGMPGAGKSTVGVVLAKTLGMAFIDTDLLIQENEKRLLSDIISRDGLEGFLRIEEQTALSCLPVNAVIATGGSMVYSARAMNHFRDQAVIIYMKLDFQTISSRISNITTRGIAMRADQSLKDIYRERQPLYESYADSTLYCNGKSLEEIVETIQSLLQYK